jgi:hypothetical protein
MKSSGVFFKNFNISHVCVFVLVYFLWYEHHLPPISRSTRKHGTKQVTGSSFFFFF